MNPEVLPVLLDIELEPHEEDAGVVVLLHKVLVFGAVPVRKSQGACIPGGACKLSKS